MALLIPEFLQTETYSGKRARLAYSHAGLIQPGVLGGTEFQITPNALMVLNVALGRALVPANDAGNAGLYFAENDAAMTTTIGTAHATLPRLDQVLLRVNDSVDGGDANDTPAIVVLAGTATAGATLDNRNGAAAVPTGHLRLADVIVGAAVTSIVAANIRDRRPWAGGAEVTLRKTTGSTTSTSGTRVVIDTALMQVRVELSGNPVFLGLNGAWTHSVNTARAMVAWEYSVAGGAFTTTARPDYSAVIQPAVNKSFSFLQCWMPPIIGGASTSFLLRATFASPDGATGTLYGSAGFPLTAHIEEEVRPSFHRGTT